MDSQVENYQQRKQALRKCYPMSNKETHLLPPTQEGIQAIKDGSNALKNADPTFPSMKSFKKELGDQEHFFVLFGCHYRRMFKDPHLLVLFDSRDKDTNVSALEHGTRLASVILSRLTGGDQYQRLKRGNLFSNLNKSHQRAKKCPFRPEKHIGKQFTQSQRKAWLGHIWAACAQMGLSSAYQKQIVYHLAAVSGFYSPFEKE